MGAEASHTARYFIADPQEPRPISVEVPSRYSGGKLILADLCADFPSARGLSDRFKLSGLAGARADLLVLRAADARFAERIDASDELRRYIPEGQPVLCLVGNADSERRPALIRPSWAAATSVEPSLEELRSIEMHGLLLGRKAILAAPRVHYEVGSGAHVRSYVRLRNAFESPRDCRRIIDWMLPSISDGCQILVAHRGLGALEAALEARLGKLFKGTVEIHRLPRYDETEGGNPHLPVSMEPDESRPQVIVIGVDTRAGGHSAEGGERARALDGYGYAGCAKLCLVDTTHPEPAGDAFAHVPIERHGADCPYCVKSEWSRYGIDVDEEVPVPLTRMRKQAKVSKSGMLDDKDLWQIIDRTSAATVHVDQRYEDPWTHETHRHRAVDIDVGKLLDDPAFYASCLEKLTLAQPEDCVVLIPDHETAPALKKLAEAAIPHPGASIHIVPRLDPVTAAGPALGHDRVLLLDDMNVSGATLGWLADKLKTHLGPGRFGEIDLRGFVVLNCAPSKDEESSVRSIFTPGDGGGVQFHWCERVPLPRPDEPCPWCDELKRLQAAMPDGLWEEHAEFFEKRIADLQVRPLVQLSPVASADKVYGSFIGNISGRTAFVRWASALQAVRAEVQIPGEGHPPSYYVDAGFIVKQWQDGAQCAGILRTASESEVRYTQQEDNFAKKWRSKAEDMQPAKLAEFGWAALEEKLTAPSAALVLETLERRAEEDPALAAYADLLAARGVALKVKVPAVAHESG